MQQTVPNVISQNFLLTNKKGKKMKTEERKKAMIEWNEIMKVHPIFSKSFLYQQAILMEASALGVKFIDKEMCRLIQSGLPVLFEDHWKKKCTYKLTEIRLSEMLECITKLNRDPGRCFNLDPGDPPWFDDPLKEGKVLPDKPPVPPLKPV